MEQHFAPGHSLVSAAWFQRAADNQIDFASCTGIVNPTCKANGGLGFYSNISRAKAHGVELEGKAHLGGVDLDANYTWTHTENDSPGNANRGKELARRPEQQANLTAGHSWSFGLTTSATISYVGESFDNASNSFKLKGYTLVGLRAAYPMTPQVEVYGRVENVTDETYQTIRNYGQPGQGAFVGVRARF